MSRADFFNKISWVSYQSLDAPPEGLSWADLERAAHLRTEKGRLYEGFYAFRMLSRKLVPFMPLMPILWLPGVEKVGSAIYRWVARNRHRLSGCEGSSFGPGGESESCSYREPE